MSDFDPYLKWLGIRDSQQPPNHYRLLGLDRFESNPEVISIAADRQMAHIRTFQIGQHGEISQKILNELAEARRCLLNDEKRSAYDKSLVTTSVPAQIIEVAPRSLQAVDPLEPPPIQPPPANPKGRAEFQPVDPSDIESSYPKLTIRSRKKSKQKYRVLIQLFAIAGGGLAAVSVSAWMIQSGWLQSFVSNNDVKAIRPSTKLEPENQPVDRTKTDSAVTAKTRKNNSRKPAKQPAVDGMRDKNSRPGTENPAGAMPIEKKTTPDKDHSNGNSIPGNSIPGNSIPGNPIDPDIAFQKLLPWDQPRWPPLPEELISPSAELDRLLQPTRIAIALREFDEARAHWRLVKLQVRALDPRIDMARQVEDLKRFWSLVSKAAAKLRLGDELVFRDTPIKVKNKNENGIFVKLVDGRGTMKFFATNLKKLDRDLVVALARKQGSYERQTD